MKAIILEAGVGSRMGDLPMNMPKCLWEINNTPILKKQITSLVENGITDVSVVVGYKSEIVKNLFKESNIKFYTNLNYKKTGMLESLFCAEGELNDEFILVYGDVYFEPKVIKKLLQDENDFCIVVSKPKKMKYESKLYFEDYYGRKNYASNSVGGYYAVRLAVLGYLRNIRRQASIFVIRYETEEYWANLGVWVCETASKKAMNNEYISFYSRENSLDFMKNFIFNKMRQDVSDVFRRSKLLNMIREQKGLREFF